VNDGIPGLTTLFTADQMDDLHWFLRGFYAKRVASVQKLSEVGDMLNCTFSSLCGVLKLLVWERKWRRSNLKKVSSTREGLGCVTKTLCTQNEANAFSLWNNNLGYQGILEFRSLGLLKLVRAHYQHNTKLIFNALHFYCLRTCMYCRCLFKISVENFQNIERSMSYAFSIAMHCVCLQAGRLKWVRAQDPKHRINYARPNGKNSL
jgi:hypothetical protein